MKTSGSAGSSGKRRNPGRDGGGLHPKAGRPSSSIKERSRDGDGDNPWRRAALSIEKTRARPAIEDRGDERRQDGRMAIGRLGAARGVDGDLKVQSYSGETAHFLRLRRVELERVSPFGTATKLLLAVRRVEEGQGGLTMSFEGYLSPESAERLVGMEIIVDRRDAAPLSEGEWYVADLVGLELVSEDGGLVYGRVRAVLDGAADPMLEIELAGPPSVGGSPEAGAAVAGPGPATALVPFRKEFVGEIDLARGKVVLVAPWVLE